MSTTALLAASVASHGLALMVAGGALSFVGVLLVGPVLVPALIRLVGGLPGAGPVRRLATGNAVRNPRRTATTAASLLVGVTLTTAVLTGLASSRTAIDTDMDSSYPLDATLTAGATPLDDDLTARVAATSGVAEAVGLSTAATETMRTAITLHHTPGVTLADGPEAYLLSAAAGVDVIGMGRWRLPDTTVESVLAERPRMGFKDEFRARWATEAAAVPNGRARLLRRYGAFDLAIRLAPYSD